MSKYLLFIFLLLVRINYHAQICASPSQYKYLYASNARASIGNGQGMWQNPQTSTAQYFTPLEGGLSVFYASGFWIGGLDYGQQLHLAATKYNSSGNDFFPGTVTTDGSASAMTNCSQYDRIFEISRQMVQTHLDYFNAVANGTEDVDFPFGYEIPIDILDYPAQGNTSIGEAENLAPFFDYNNDGIYNPYDGDCPLFAGMGVEADCASCDLLQGGVAFYWINNDIAMTHSESGGASFGVEIHNVAYAYPNSNIPEISRSTFYQKKIINRSIQDYHDVYLGVYVDADIGNSTDDYVGCDIGRNLGYCYNGDPEDEPISSSPGYGANPPAAGVIILKGPLAEEDQLDNDGDGIVDNETLGMSKFVYYNISGQGMNDPSVPFQYYNYLTGFWKDGAPLIYGGNGHDNNTGVITSYMFPDDYVLPGFSPWTEEAIQTPPGDRRFLMSVGPFDLAAGQEVCLQYATVVGFPTGNLTAVEKMKSNADYIINEFDAYCDSFSANIDAPAIDENQISMAFVNEILSIENPTNNGNQLVVVNALGQVVYEKGFGQSTEVSLHFLKSGLYIAQVTDSAEHRKVVKIRR